MVTKDECVNEGEKIAFILDLSGHEAPQDPFKVTDRLWLKNKKSIFVKWTFQNINLSSAFAGLVLKLQYLMSYYSGTAMLPVKAKGALTLAMCPLGWFVCVV